MSTLRKILLLSDLLALLSAGLLGPIYALYVEKIGGDLLDASNTFALFMLTSGIVVFLVAKWEDRSKYKREIVIVSYGLAMIGTTAYLLVSSTWELFLVQILLGFANALKYPAYDALFSSEKKHLALAWGEWEAVDYFSLGIGALVGGLTADYFGFFALLEMMVVLAICSFFVSAFLLQVRRTEYV